MPALLNLTAKKPVIIESCFIFACWLSFISFTLAQHHSIKEKYVSGSIAAVLCKISIKFRSQITYLYPILILTLTYIELFSTNNCIRVNVHILFCWTITSYLSWTARYSSTGHVALSPLNVLLYVGWFYDKKVKLHGNIADTTFLLIMHCIHINHTKKHLMTSCSGKSLHHQ